VCGLELSDLQTSVVNKYKGTPQAKDLLVFAIHQNENPKLLADFVKQTGIEFTVINDNNTQWAFNWPPGTGYPFPRDVIIDKKGVVRSIKSSFSIEEVKAEVAKLMVEKP